MMMMMRVTLVLSWVSGGDGGRLESCLCQSHARLWPLPEVEAGGAGQDLLECPGVLHREQGVVEGRRGFTLIKLQTVEILLKYILLFTLCSVSFSVQFCNVYNTLFHSTGPLCFNLDRNRPYRKPVYRHNRTIPGQFNLPGFSTSFFFKCYKTFLWNILFESSIM